MVVDPVKRDAVDKLSSCHILFDAGSSGTRLYIYEKQGNNWIEHQGPKVAALADPIREMRGKKESDIDAVTTELVSAFDSIKQDPPLIKGESAWTAFNWQQQCHVTSLVVYATAGMRIAEQENPVASTKLWVNLRQKLQTKFGKKVSITARTLSGYEEGLYAWLAVKEQKKRTNFGVVEMGGASSQITFPCPSCDASDDAIKIVMVNGNPVQIYSYSFLGVGLDEVAKTFGMPTACSYGIGVSQPNWTTNDCANQLVISGQGGMRDPYNFNGNQRGTSRNIPTNLSNVSDWILTGAFKHMNDSQIDSCCIKKGRCVNEETSCFRAIYLNKYLEALNIPKTAEKLESKWTLGAVICATENCLPKASAPICRWSNTGCL